MTIEPTFDQCAIAIMAKAPRNGHVKTRLAPALPAEQVVKLYTCLLADTIRLATSLDGVRVALVCPGEDIVALRDLAGKGVTVLPQEGRGLAAALDSVFPLLLGPDCRRVIALDSDSPHLPAAILARAFALLKTYDLVVGPTTDGGYYLVGATAAHPGLFDAPRMGTGTALAALLTRADEAALTVAQTPEWYDVDQTEDLARLATDLRADPARAPATAALLQELGL